MVRYYVDGEEEASIEFQPALACGTGFGDERAPWGNSIIGHGASVGGWYHNLKIPFYKSIKVTLQTDAVFGTVPYYMIVRGAEGLSPRECRPVREHARLKSDLEVAVRSRCRRREPAPDCAPLPRQARRR